MPTDQKVLSKGLIDLFTRGLTEFHSDSQRANAPDFDVNRLARELCVTKACVYKWMRPNKDDSIPYNKAMQIIEISEKQCGKYELYTPLTINDLKNFIS